MSRPQPHAQRTNYVVVHLQVNASQMQGYEYNSVLPDIGHESVWLNTSTSAFCRRRTWETCYIQTDGLHLTFGWVNLTNSYDVRCSSGERVYDMNSGRYFQLSVDGHKHPSLVSAASWHRPAQNCEADSLSASVESISKSLKVSSPDTHACEISWEDEPTETIPDIVKEMVRSVRNKDRTWHAGRSVDYLTNKYVAELTDPMVVARSPCRWGEQRIWFEDLVLDTSTVTLFGALQKDTAGSSIKMLHWLRHHKPLLRLVSSQKMLDGLTKSDRLYELAKCVLKLWCKG